jgi:hypothetical protein
LACDLSLACDLRWPIRPRRNLWVRVRVETPGYVRTPSGRCVIRYFRAGNRRIERCTQVRLWLRPEAALCESVLLTVGFLLFCEDF